MKEIVVDPSVLAVFVLVTCLTCLWLVFVFGRRLQSSAYLRDSLVEGAKQQELRVLVRELRDRAMEGPLDPAKPPPDGYGPTVRLWDEKYRQEEASVFLEYVPPDETTQARDERLAKLAERRQQLQAFKQWEIEEKVRFDVQRKEREAYAAEQAKKKVPTDIDISLLGGGWAFLLEFSTVIVIIFTLLILGILKILAGEQISTILAAIAGYVLGKATATKQQEKTAGEASTGPSGK